MIKISSRFAVAFAAAMLAAPLAVLAQDAKLDAPSYINDMCDYCGTFTDTAAARVETAYVPLMGYVATRTAEAAPAQSEARIARAPNVSAKVTN